MSLLAAVLWLAAAPAGAPMPALAAPTGTADIEVIGQKLKDWRGTWGSKKGVLACRTTRSTGDAEIDAVGCQALVACAGPMVPQFKAIAAAKLRKAERQRRMDAASQSLVPCLEETRASAIAALADRRAGG